MGLEFSTEYRVGFNGKNLDKREKTNKVGITQVNLNLGLLQIFTKFIMMMRKMTIYMINISNLFGKIMLDTEKRATKLKTLKSIHTLFVSDD